MVPIVSSNRKNGNACQYSPEHGNKMYERGGTCTPVQPYISTTGGGAHPGESCEFQVVPIVCSSRENGNACQYSPEHGNKMYERGGGPADQCSHTFQVLGVGHI